MKKKITALLLVMAMIATVLPFSAFAAEGQSQYGSGLDDGATYALKVPTDKTAFGQAYQWSNGGYNLTIRHENGESFVEYGEKAMQYFEGEWNTSIYAAGTTYAPDLAKKNQYAGGVPSTEDVSDTKYIAWRIKINDNNPVGSYTVSRFKPYISCGGQYGLHGTTSEVPAYFYDLTDGSYNAWYGNNGFWKSSEGAFSVVGDLDGYIITPYALNSGVTAEKIASSFTNLQIFFYENKAVSSGDNQRKESDWDNKEFLLGDCFFIEDIDKFVDARNAARGIVQYSSNKGDGAYIANKVNGATRNAVRGWAWTSAKAFCDPTLETATNSYTYAHVAKISDDELGVVFTNNTGYSSGGNRSVPLNGTYPTSHSTSDKFQSTDGIPEEIDLSKMKYLAQRVVFKGTEANPLNGQGFRLYLNNSTQAHLNSTAKVILIEDGKSQYVTYNGGLDFYKDFDGWILVPMSGWSDAYWADAHTTWSGGFQFFADGDWTEKTLIIGNLYFVEDADKFCEKHGAAIEHNFEILDKVEATCTEDGFTTYMCADCGLIEDKDIVKAKGHDIEILSGTPATCTEDGFVSERCRVCDYEHQGEQKALGHDFTLTVIKPTQFEDGYTLHECERCGYSYKDDYVDAAADDTVRIMFYAFSGWAKSYTTDGVNTTEDQLREIEDVLAQGYVNTINMGTGAGFEKRIALCRKYNVKFWMGLEKFYSDKQTLDNYINNVEVSVNKIIDAGAWDLFLGFHWDEPIWGGMSNEDFYAMTKTLYEKWGKRNYPVFAGGSFVDGYEADCDKIAPEYMTYVTDAGWDSYSYDVRDSALTSAKQNAQLKKNSQSFGVTLSTAKDFYRFWQSELDEKIAQDVNFWFYPCAYYHYTWTGGYSDESYNLAHLNFFNELLQEQKYKGGLALYTYATYSDTSAPGLNQYLPVPNIETGEQIMYPDVPKWNTLAARIKELKAQYDNTPIKFEQNLNFGSLYVRDVTINSITINPLDGYQYSIDGGNTFTTEKTFSNLTADTAYTITVKRLTDGKTKDFVVYTEKENRYASGMNDTASYMLDIPENLKRFTNTYGWIAATNSRNADDTAFTGDSNGSIFLKTVNGERFLEIKNSNSDAPTSLDLSLGDQTRAKSEKGIPEEIDATKLQYIAVRMKTKGGTADQISTFDIYISSKRLHYTGTYPVKFIDYSTLEVSDVTYKGGMQFKGEVDGWVIIPIDAYASFGDASNLMWLKNNISSIQIWQHVNGCQHGATGSSWADRILYFGDMFWLEDMERFIQARKAPNAPAASVVCADRITIDAEKGAVYSIDGGKTWLSEPTFTGLKASTAYTVMAKYEFGTDVSSATITTLAKHTYRGKITRPTCTEQGYTIFTCSTCGDSYKGNVRPAAGHTWTKGETIAPTCDKAGHTIYICSTCNATENRDEVAALGHKYTDTVVPPTTTSQGYTDHTCSVCGDNYKDNYKDPVEPGTPTNKVSGVVVTPSDVDVTVTWDSFEGADRYLVRALNPDGTTFNTQTITDGSNKAVFKGFEYDTEYTFYVIARAGGKYQSVDDADKIASGLVIGDRVVGIKSSVKGRVITVNWMAYPNATNYYVMVYPKGADPTVNANRVTTVNAGNNTTANIINVIAPETDYEIYVSARVNGKYQSLENALYTSAVIPVTAPSSFEITSIEPTIVRIKWNAVKNADRYWARLVDENGATVKTRECAKALVSFTGLTPGKTYYVQLQARVPKSSGGNQYSGYCDPILTQPITLPLK